MNARSAAWDGETLVLRIPFSDFAAAIEYLDTGDRRHRIENHDLLKAFITERAFRTFAIPDSEGGDVDAITVWIDLLLQLAANEAAGIKATCLPADGGTGTKPGGTASANAPHRANARGLAPDPA